jgi:drug/metabolite transporter (DMT)-like permease
MSHRDAVSEVPEGFSVTAVTETCLVASMEDASRNLYATQFHPEVRHSVHGNEMLSNFLFNTLVMRKPFVGEPVTYGQYFNGNFKTHLVGMLGGAIWCLGTALSYITAEKAGPAISYALGQGAPMVAAIWGVFIWKEFKGAKKGVYGLLAAMFCLFIAGLALIVIAGK